MGYAETPSMELLVRVVADIDIRTGTAKTKTVVADHEATDDVASRLWDILKSGAMEEMEADNSVGGGGA